MDDFRTGKENEAVDFKMSPDGAWEIYIRKLNHLPRLRLQEEFELARSYQNQDDREAGSRLINAHLRLVFKIAMKFRVKTCLDQREQDILEHRLIAVTPWPGCTTGKTK